MITPIGLAGFCLLNAVSPDNDTPERASRPFDATRNGFVLGEGAGFLVLEEWESARRRGARIYAELAGDGNSLSSYRITDSHPSGDGPIQAMRQALEDAGAPLDRGGLPERARHLDADERSQRVRGGARGVRRAGARVAVSSTKSVMGHLIAAAGAVEAAICALAIQHGVLPVNANLREVDPECDLDIVRDEPRKRRVRVAMSNSLRLRRLEQLSGVPQSRRGGRRCGCVAGIEGEADGTRPKIVVTGAGALCAAGKHLAQIWERFVRAARRCRRSASGTPRTGLVESRARLPTSIRWRC